MTEGNQQNDPATSSANPATLPASPATMPANPAILPANPDHPGTRRPKKSKVVAFSPEGLKEFEVARDNLEASLRQACAAVAIRKQSDSISAGHVQIALETFDIQQNRRTDRIREIGILLIGAGLGYLTITVFGDSFTAKNLLLSFIPLMLGCILYAYCMDSRK